MAIILFCFMILLSIAILPRLCILQGLRRVHQNCSLLWEND